MKLRNSTKTYIIGLILTASAFITGCQPEEFEVDADSFTSPELDASFTVTKVPGKMNTFVVKKTGSMDNTLGLKWDFGNGYVIGDGSTEETIFYPDVPENGQDYTIKLYAKGRGGVTFSSEQKAPVTEPDPLAGNLILNSAMNGPSNWTVIRMGTSDVVTMNFVDGKLVAKGTSGGHVAVYQAVNVEAGQKYKFDFHISGSGVKPNSTWYEAYISTTPPVDGTDYSADGKRWSFNTWSNCNRTAFSGYISTMDCAEGSLKTASPKGTLTFPTSGTVYVLIKTGVVEGGDLGETGVALDNVELRRYQE